MLSGTIQFGGLQWGHRFISVETKENRRDPYQLSIASMGPPIYIGGNLQLSVYVLDRYSASMGPPIYIGGNLTKTNNS